MIDESIKRGLGSLRKLERLSSARALATSATVTDLPLIHSQLMAETDAFVREALNRVLEQIALSVDGNDEPQPDAPGDDALSVDEIRTQAIEHTAKLFLHELRPALGSIAANASRDLGEDYPNSNTANRVQRALSVLEVITRLADAAGAPHYREIDLTEIVNRIIADEFSDSQHLIMLARTDPVVVILDPDLLGVAVANVLRNALESTKEAMRVPKLNILPVVVNWGATNQDVWITVLDDGIGLPAGFHRATEPGNTTKSKRQHLGWGLTIAQQAAASMQGDINLSPGKGRGASCEFHWPVERSTV